MPRSNAPKAPMVTKPLPAPMVIKPLPAPMVVKPSLFSTLKDGFAFGIGSSVARHAVDAMLRPALQTKPKLSEYEQCLAENRDFLDGASMCAYHLIEAKESK